MLTLYTISLSIISLTMQQLFLKQMLQGVLMNTERCRKVSKYAEKSTTIQKTKKVHEKHVYILTLII